MRTLETRKLENSLLKKLDFSKYFLKSKDFSIFNPLQMNYRYRQVINIIREVYQGIRRVIKPKKSKYTRWRKS